MKVFVSVLLALAAISGLTEASIEYPAVVSLQVPGDNGDHYDVCTGVIISPTTILTVALCVYGVGVSMITAGMSEVTEGKTYPLASYLQQIDVVKTIIHPDYGTVRSKLGFDITNDIALLKLSRKLKNTNYVQPLSLPTENSTLVDDSTVLAAGWGQYFDADNRQQVRNGTLSGANVTALNYQTCYDAVFDIFAIPEDIPLDKDLTQCAGPLSDGNSLPPTYCSFGGPLIHNNQVVGVSSWALSFWNNEDAVGKKGPVGFYTRVSRFVSWIKQHTDDL